MTVLSWWKRVVMMSVCAKDCKDEWCIHSGEPQPTLLANYIPRNTHLKGFLFLLMINDLLILGESYHILMLKCNTLTKPLTFFSVPVRSKDISALFKINSRLFYQSVSLIACTRFVTDCNYKLCSTIFTIAIVAGANKIWLPVILKLHLKSISKFWESWQH